MGESGASKWSWRTFLDTAATAVLIAACSAIVWRVVSPASTPSRPQRRAEPALPATPISVDGISMKGRATAPVVMIEYSDFECPYCRRFARETLPALDQKYIVTGRVQLAFSHLPIERIHASALAASVAAQCAAEQGRFWDLHDALFATESLAPSAFTALVAGLKLDAPRFEACDRVSAEAHVRKELASAAALGIKSTPTFLFGTREPDGKIKVVSQLAGARPLADFEAAIGAIAQ